MVERDLAKVEVAGSKPVSRSTFAPQTLSVGPIGFRGRRIHSVVATPADSDALDSRRPRASAGRIQPSVSRGRRFI